MSETTDLAAAVQAAHDKVTDMCSGSGRWTMSIPVRLDHDHDVVITRALTMQADALAAARREVETVNEEAERQAGVICNLNTELATLRAQLAGVRERVEKLDRYDPIVDCNEPYMEHTGRGDYFACADVLAALGGDA